MPAPWRGGMLHASAICIEETHMQQLHGRRTRTEAPAPWARRRNGRGATLAASALAIAAVLSAGTTGVSAASRSNAPGPARVVGAVYIATNAWNGGNSILTFPRFADGSLGPVSAAVSTGGRGSGPGQFAPIVNDPLGSQNSLITDADAKFLFAVNAGSGDISSFTADRDGLALVDRQPSVPAGVTGQDNPFPVSLASSKKVLYALNAIGNSLTGFTVNGAGHLNAFQNCVLPGLPAGNALNTYPATPLSSEQAVDTQLPGQVGFSPDGKWLVVISKEGPISTTTPPGGTGDLFPFGPTSGPGHIYSYQVDPKGQINCAAPRVTTLPVFVDGHGTFPFSFTWSAKGTLLVTEVFGKSDQPSSLPGGLSSVASFTLNRDGSFTLLRNVADPLPVPCWIVRSGDNLFVASFLGPDFGQGAISTFQIGPDGGVIDPSPALAPTVGLAGGSDPIDVALTADGRFLYQLAPGPSLNGPTAPTFQVYPFAVGPNGSLSPLQAVNDGLGGADAAAHANAGEFGIATVTFK
jgi:6-phosphogluconolactonase